MPARNKRQSGWLCREETDLTWAQIAEIAEVEGDSLDFVEVVMALEEQFKLKIPLR